MVSQLIGGLIFAIIAIVIITQMIFPYVSEHTAPEGGIEGTIGETGDGGSGNWKYDIIDKLVKSQDSPKRAEVGPYIFTSSLEMLGHSFGSQVYYYFNMSNTICCDCEPQDENNWQVCVVESCDETPKQIQVVGPSEVDALTERELYTVIVETGDDWICLMFQVIE